MSRLMDRAEEVRALLAAVDGLTAITDPAHVSANLPCVLVAPPRLDYSAKTASWRLLVLGPGLATLAAVSATADLLELVESVLPVELAEPGSYAVGGGTELVACYVATWVDSLTDWP